MSDTEPTGPTRPITDHRIRLVVAVPHARTRAAIRAAVEATGEIVVAAEPPSALQIATRARVAGAQVVLVDLALLPRGSSPRLEDVIRKVAPAVVITVGLDGDDSFRRASLRAGAAGHLLTDATPDEYLRAVQAALCGGAVHVSPSAC
jgi:DNA-binding NarL/FixJ family response regulator